MTRFYGIFSCIWWKFEGKVLRQPVGTLVAFEVRLLPGKYP